MRELRELFIKHLTNDTDPNIASAIFNTNGYSNWNEIRLDMIINAFDDALKEYIKSVK